ncbi:MAG: response regulator [Candidatus Aureabacteria bacterium]|nr:response regulator [Candidatus Auribacterota bacterium]MCK5160801.1 response regulator [Candidatus Auribacterota bacterium]
MSKKILVIDDEPQIVKALKIRLESSGYEVVHAYDGKEGLKKLEEEHPDLIILDVMMPNMDGYTFAREVKFNPDTEHIPIIILTVKEKMKDLFELEGINDYILKPFEHQDLLNRIEKLLERKNGDNA